MDGGMMDWQARLTERREIFSERPDTLPPKLTKPGFVGSVSAPAPHSENIAPDSAALRIRLLTAAEAEYADPDLIHRLPAADVASCEGLPDDVLRAYVRALEADAERMAGRVPAGETAAILCVRCGPVWAHPDVAAVLPVVHDTARALGCPWCHVRKAGKVIPRPPVTCATCTHYKPDTVNPTAGVGTCPDHGTHYPMQRHRCGDWRPDSRHGTHGQGLE
jgi:hypothetical protein